MIRTYEVPDGFFLWSCGFSDWTDSIWPWAYHCIVRTPTECNQMSEAVLCLRNWGLGCSQGWHSTPPQSTSDHAWVVCTAPAQSSCLSMLPVWKATSRELDAICNMDIRAMQALAAYCLHTLLLLVLEGHPRGQAWEDAHPSTPCQWSDGMHRYLLCQHRFFYPAPVYHIWYHEWYQ